MIGKDERQLWLTFRNSVFMGGMHEGKYFSMASRNTRPRSLA